MAHAAPGCTMAQHAQRPERRRNDLPRPLVRRSSIRCTRTSGLASAEHAFTDDGGRVSSSTGAGASGTWRMQLHGVNVDGLIEQC